jgi:hypothetical protein
LIKNKAIVLIEDKPLVHTLKQVVSLVKIKLNIQECEKSITLIKNKSIDEEFEFDNRHDQSSSDSNISNYSYEEKKR